jgi:hypothetical protein
VEKCQKFLCMEHIIPMCEECVSASKENDCGYGKVKETIFNKFMQIFLLVIYMIYKYFNYVISFEITFQFCN